LPFRALTRADEPVIPDQLTRFRDLRWWMAQTGADNNPQDNEFFAIGIQNGGTSGSRECQMTQNANFDTHVVRIANNSQLGDCTWGFRINGTDRDTITIPAGDTGVFRSTFTAFVPNVFENANWKWNLQLFDANNFDLRDFAAGGQLLV